MSALYERLKSLVDVPAAEIFDMMITAANIQSPDWMAMTDTDLVKSAGAMGWKPMQAVPAGTAETAKPDPLSPILDALASVKGRTPAADVVRNLILEALAAAPADDSEAVMSEEARKKANMPPDMWAGMPPEFRSLLAAKVREDLSHDGRFLSGIERAKFEIGRIFQDFRELEAALLPPQGPVPSAPVPAAAPAPQGPVPAAPSAPASGTDADVAKVLRLVSHREVVGSGSFVIGEHSYQGTQFFIAFSTGGCVAAVRQGDRWSAVGQYSPHFSKIFTGQRETAKSGAASASAPATIKIWAGKRPDGSVEKVTLKSILDRPE